jgi:hypothetical protein
MSCRFRESLRWLDINGPLSEISVKSFASGDSMPPGLDKLPFECVIVVSVSLGPNSSLTFRGSWIVAVRKSGVRLAASSPLNIRLPLVPLVTRLLDLGV